jgi:hypothetical protein
MGYIGNQPTSTAFVTDLFSGDASTTAFTMSVAPANTASILVAVSGVVQSPDTYSISGTTLTFSAAPPTGTGNISVRYLGIPATNITTTAYRTVTEFTATAGQTTFSVPSYTVGYIDVYRNGVRLGTADYTATSGTSVVLAAGATLGDLITTESFYVSSVLNAIPATGGAVNNTYLDAGNANGTGALLTPSGTTAQRPASPAAGMQRWNTTLGIMEAWTGTVWQQITSLLYSASYLVVAGGGAGGYDFGGGGGAGGLLTGTIALNSGTSFAITVGAGGATSNVTGTQAGSGSSSVFTGVATVLGGGGGGAINVTGVNGGSGGGGGAKATSGTIAGGTGTSGQGFAGGTGLFISGTNNNFAGGGGGGSGAVGANGVAGQSGAGGAGTASSISGSSVTYGGGGGGGGYNGPASVPTLGGSGGSGGGGAGSGGNTGAGTAGSVNTGGGGGAGSGGSGNGAAGGSGVVIIAYLGSQRGTGGTVTSSGGYTIHTFTTSGTYTA